MLPPIAVFRADASPAIGTGHVVRCRTLATALAAHGWNVVLATAEAPEALLADWPGGPANTIYLRAGEEVKVPGPTELARLTHKVGGPADLVVGDHYGIDQAWINAAREQNPDAVLMAIDDLADRTMPVDLLLNQNLGVAPGTYRKLIPADATLLLGPKYALVRPEFAIIRDRGIQRRNGVNRAIVMMGGADENDVTLRAVEALGAIGLPFDVVVGAAYPHRANLEQIIANQHPAACIHVNSNSVADLTDSASLAIGAPGSASWERCTLGVPSLLVTVADNQVAVGQELDRLGAALLLGWHADVNAAEIEAIVRELQSSPARLVSMSRAALAITDGHGTKRVVETILAAVRGRIGTQ